MASFQVQVRAVHDLAVAFPNVDHYDWQIRDEQGSVVARSLVTYGGADRARAQAQQALAALPWQDGRVA